MPTNVTAAEAIARLKEGNARYTSDTLTSPHPRINTARREELKGHQDPFVITLNCADSRVIPEAIFDEGIGDVFDVRVAGNIADDASIASIEYAVAHLKVKLILVMGHEGCGAVGAAIADGDNGHYLNLLTAQIKPAVKATAASHDLSTKEGNDACILRNAEDQAKALVDRSPIIANAVANEGLIVKPVVYKLASGVVEGL